MQFNRREFVTLSSLGVLTLSQRSLFAQAPGAAQAPTVPKFEDVRRNVGVFTARGGTMGYLVTPDAVVVVDSQFADTAPLLVDGLKTRSTRKIDLLINSHHHGDHTGGNAVLRPAAAKLRRALNGSAMQPM